MSGIKFPQAAIIFPLHFGVDRIMFLMAKQSQILYSIICFVSVYMVDVLVFDQLSAQVFFHNQAVLKDLLTPTDRHRYIPSRVSGFPIFPKWMSRSNHVKTGAFFGAEYSYRQSWLERLKAVLTFLRWQSFRASICIKTLLVLPCVRARERAEELSAAFVCSFTPITPSAVYFRHGRIIPFLSC